MIKNAFSHKLMSMYSSNNKNHLLIIFLYIERNLMTNKHFLYIIDSEFRCKGVENAQIF